MRKIAHTPSSSRVPSEHTPTTARSWGVFKDGIEDAPAPKFSMVSMFSGCGGVDLGFRFAGFKTLWANDIDADACDTFRQNLGDVIQKGDIREIKLPNIKRRVDVLAACFPCQSFSNAGKRRGVNDTNGKLNDFALKGVRHFKPSVVIYENVRGMLSVKVGDKLLIQIICDKLRRYGYHVYLRLVNASDYSVPQNRQRVFIVGVKANKFSDGFGFPAVEKKEKLTVGDTIMDIDNDAYNVGDIASLGPSAQFLCDRIPEGGSWKNIKDSDLSARFLNIRRRPDLYRAPNFYRCFSRDEVAGTITAAFKPEHSGVLHPTELRVYSVREAARIQSFPDWFEFYGNGVSSRCRQVGNAVPPRLAYEIAIAIAGFLKGRPVKEPRPKINLSKFLSEKRPLRVSDATVKHEKRRTK